MLTQLCLLFFLIADATAGHENISPILDLTGCVLSESGKPLSGVDVYVHSHNDFGSAKTDAEGKYEIRFLGDRYKKFENANRKECCAIHFSLEGYRSRLYGVSPGTQRLDVILQAEKDWVPPRCAPSMAKERVGFTMKLLPPKRAVVKIMNSGNAHIFIQIRIGPKKNHEEIVIGTSPMWGGGEPPSKERVSSSSDVLARDMFFLGGVDYSGRDPKGNRWREISIGGESIYYQDISEKTAAYFDQIINSMCIDTTNAPPYFRNRYSVVDESH